MWKIRQKSYKVGLLSCLTSQVLQVVYQVDFCLPAQYKLTKIYTKCRPKCHLQGCKKVQWGWPIQGALRVFGKSTQRRCRTQFRYYPWLQRRSCQRNYPCRRCCTRRTKLPNFHYRKRAWSKAVPTLALGCPQVEMAGWQSPQWARLHHLREEGLPSKRWQKDREKWQPQLGWIAWRHPQNCCRHLPFWNWQTQKVQQSK